jgi:dihydroxy-acid dehydratase
MHAERFDGFVGLAGCDKSLPAMMMAAARIDVPMVFVYAGSIMPGVWRDRALDIVSVFEAVGEHSAGTISDEDLYQIEKNACPGEGACAGMFTANTMAAIGEALGLSLPTGASAPAVDRRRDDVAYDSGRAVVAMLVRERDRRIDGSWWLHEFGAASPRDRKRGESRPQPRGLPSGR